MTTISVIIPTTAAIERAAVLRRAVETVLSQRGLAIRVIVVANGPRVNPAALRDLPADDRISVHFETRGSLPNALRVGRQLVGTEFFSELDDDDVLLPDALSARLRALQEHPEWDVVVSNGIRRSEQSDEPHRPNFETIRQGPLEALADGNWLLPGSWLARSAAFDARLFELMPSYLECTYLAVRFALTGRLGFLDTPSVIWHAGGNTSSSRAFLLGQPQALRHLLEFPLPPRLRKTFARQLAGAHHHIADIYRREGDLKLARPAHWRSLIAGGWRYLTFTRRLLWNSLPRKG